LCTDSGYFSPNFPPAPCVLSCMAPAPAKHHKDIGMEGMVAKWYAANSGKRREQHTRLARRIGGQLPSGSTVLELAPGPGFFSIDLAKLGPYRITGLDLSHTFVEIASRNAAEAGVRVDFRQGNASAMPFANDTFDFLLCAAAFKNFGQPVVALVEMCRVLKPGGRGLIVDLRHDVSPDLIGQYVSTMNLSAINRILTKLVFRTMLLKNAYTREQFQRMLVQTAFRIFDIQEVDIGFEISMVK
jgi:ubiquinone/menaquinone biosynthesis C-methylase UbiE